MSRRGRICFFSEYLYPVLRGEESEFAGGAETQLAKLARGLSARGFEVSVVTCDFGQPAVEDIDGITVHRAHPPHGGLPVLRFFHPRLSRAVAALCAADADVYYVCGAGFPAGLANDVAHWRGARFALAVASDYDVEPHLPRYASLRDRWWYRRALKGADVRLAQTQFQMDRLRDGFGLDSVLFPNIVELPVQPVDVQANRMIAWLGTYKEIKRPQWFVDLARGMPDYEFVMAGVIPPPPIPAHTWEHVRTEAEGIPNLTVSGAIPHERVHELHRRTALLVHTSPVEGFSNVLLEAWAAGIPTVSAVNPDGIVARHGLGAAFESFEEMSSYVEALMTDPGVRAEAGRSARSYATRVHNESAVLDALEAVMSALIPHVGGSTTTS